MKVHPFVEAEKAAGHSVNNACRLLEVSHSAIYSRLSNPPSRRAVTDAELLIEIRAIHAESKGTYGSPRIHKELGHRQVTFGQRRVRRLMCLAGLEGRCKKRYRKTTTPDPAAELARDLIQREFGPCQELDRRYVGDITYMATCTRTHRDSTVNAPRNSIKSSQRRFSLVIHGSTSCPDP